MDAPPYLDQMRHLDDALAELVRSLPPGSNLLCISDHGGHDYGHRLGTALDVIIPFLAWGPGVYKGRVIDSAVTTLDVAPTLAHLLGVSGPATWTSGLIGEALDGDLT